MSRLEAQAERIKLARLFDVPEERLHAYVHLEAVHLRALREAASAVIFDDARPTLSRAAAASKLLPVSALALVGEKVFGAMLCARIAGLIAPQRALEVTLKLPDAFLVKVSSQIDPRSAKEVIACIPVPRVKAVAALLIQRADYVTMGRFVDYVSRETIRSVIEDIHDNAVLLHVAFYVENKSRLNDIIDLLPASRLLEIVKLSAHREAGIWPEALSLMNQVSPEWRGRIADLTADEDEAFLTQLLRLTQEGDLWDALLPVIACMSPAHRRKLAQLPALADVDVLRSIMASAHTNNLWASLLPLVSFMPEPARKAAAKVVEHLPREVLLHLLETASTQNLWPDLVGVLAMMDETEKRAIVQLLGEQDAAVLQQLLIAMDQAGLWGEILPLVRYMGETARRIAARLVPQFPQAMLMRLIETTDQLNLWTELLVLSDDMDDAELRTIADLVTLQETAVVRRLLQSANAQDFWPQLLPIAARMSDEGLQRTAVVLDELGEALPEIEAHARKLGLWDRLSILHLSLSKVR